MNALSLDGSSRPLLLMRFSSQPACPAQRTLHSFLLCSVSCQLTPNRIEENGLVPALVLGYLASSSGKTAGGKAHQQQRAARTVERKRIHQIALSTSSPPCPGCPPREQTEPICQKR
jgi:hypothetical protein